VALDSKVFKAYDVRGLYPEELDEDGAYRIARAYAEEFEPSAVAVGRDMRVSSPTMAGAAIEGVLDAGVDVVDVGMIGTEMLYFGVGELDLDGGFTITASHNPKEYTGMKIVRRGALPVGGGEATTTADGEVVAAPVGLETVPLEMEFVGDFFRLADFFHDVKRFVHVANQDVIVNGRLVTIDSVSYASDPVLFPRLRATIKATVYLSPKAEGATAGATPEGPAVTTPATTPAATPAPAATPTPAPTATATP